MKTDLFARLTLFFAGAIGAAGVIFSAMAAHGGDAQRLGAAAATCLANGPALLALYAGFRAIPTAVIASLLLVVGTVLFAGDLLFRTYAGSGLFPMSAPTGGTIMILGWLAIAAGALFRRQA